MSKITKKHFTGKTIHFIKIFKNFERYCMWDSEMEFKELQERLVLQKQNPKMFKSIHGEIN